MRGSTVKRDLLGGLLLFVVGIAAILEGRTYDIGTLTRMGTGFFPVVLGGVLAALGGLIALSALRSSSPAVDPFMPPTAILEMANTPSLRGFVAIVLSIVAFIVLGKFFGLAPAAFFTVFISALGDRTSTIKRAAILAVILTVFALVVFSYLLQIQLPVFQVPAAWSNA
jgi:Tripartite tricarboxylate transporter TctB family